MSDYRIVYSSEGDQKDKRKQKEEKPLVEIIPNEITLKIRPEKKGRGGKIVTVIYDFPYNPAYFKKLAKKLKSVCGVGGAFKEDRIEIQGDNREKVKKFLTENGFQIKFTGG